MTLVKELEEGAIRNGRAPMAKIVDGYPPAMPPAVVTDVEAQSIAMFIETLK